MVRVLRIFTGLLLLLFIGCQKEVKEEIVKYYKDGNPKVVRYYYLKGDNKQYIKETQFYQDGKKLMDGGLSENGRSGKWISWYKNGKVWSKGHFKNNIREGNSRIYYDNGNLKIEGNYSNGLRDGVWCFYSKRGIKTKEVTYKDNNLVSEKFLNKKIPYKQ